MEIKVHSSPVEPAKYFICQRPLAESSPRTSMGARIQFFKGMRGIGDPCCMAMCLAFWLQVWRLQEVNRLKIKNFLCSLGRGWWAWGAYPALQAE
ncbi:MAG: hypothetical protein P8104_08370 [Gammaproteobacteria bacterium]